MRTVLTTLALLAALLGPVRADATSAILVSEVEQAEMSTAVVVATVVSQRPSVHPQYGRPMTLTTLDIERTLVGKAPAQVEIHQMGGERDGQTLHVPGDARWEIGERAVVYLRQVDGQWYLTAMEQSKYRIIPSIDGEVLERELSGGLYVRQPNGSLSEWDGRDDSAPTLLDLVALFHDAALTPEVK